MKEKSVLLKTEKEKLLKVVNPYEKIEKKANISSDGKNFVIRIPKEVADYLGITKENKNKKAIKFIIKEENDKINKTFEVTER